MPKLVKKSFSIFGAFSKSESKSNDCREKVKSVQE